MSNYAKKIRHDYMMLSLKAFQTKYPGLCNKCIAQLSDAELEEAGSFLSHLTKKAS